jgi:DNA-binding NarL/FixJ family response regulator
MTGATRIRVLLADDHALFRKALAILFREEPDFEVVGEAADGIEAIAQAAALRPDVILMDMRMPRADGPAATRRILETSPDAKIVMLTVSGDEDSVVDAVQSGAQGYLLKTIDPPALFDALRGVVRGEAALASGVATTIMRAFTRAGLHSAVGTPPRAELNAREREIVALVAEGKSNKEIATRLGLAENTVKNHLKNILATLHLENRVQVAVSVLNEHRVFRSPENWSGRPPSDTKKRC